MNDLVSRLLRALVSGLVVGLIVALVLLVVSALLPGVEIDASFWGFVVGAVCAIYTFVTRRDAI